MPIPESGFVILPFEESESFYSQSEETIIETFEQIANQIAALSKNPEK